MVTSKESGSLESKANEVTQTFEDNVVMSVITYICFD